MFMTIQSLQVSRTEGDQAHWSRDTEAGSSCIISQTIGHNDNNNYGKDNDVNDKKMNDNL